MQSTGNAAGAPLGSAILNGSGGNWHAVACYSGGIQIVGVVLMLYGACSSIAWRTEVSPGACSALQERATLVCCVLTLPSHCATVTTSRSADINATGVFQLCVVSAIHT